MDQTSELRIMDRIKSLEKSARELDPTEDKRSLMTAELIEYTNNFLKRLDDAPGYSRGRFDKLSALEIADNGKAIDTLIDILETEVDNSGISSASGKHMGFIPGGGLWAAAMGDMLGSIANKYSGIAFSGPGAVKIETQLIRWMCSLVGYPETAFGNLTSGGSIANLIAIKAARDFHQINSGNVKQSVIYCGEQTHHSIYKALHTTGLHEAQLRKISLTENYQLDIKQLKKQITEDRINSLEPFLIIASAGTTDTGAVDPLDEMAAIAKENKCWYHIDAAYGGFFMLTDSCRGKLKGIEKSDSLVLDPHKTLFMPFGSGAVLVKDVSRLLQSNSSKASYLADTDGFDEINPSDTGIELTRPNRGLRIWLPLQLHGVAAFKACLEEKILLTEYFYTEIKKLDLETGPFPDLTVTIFRYPEKGNEINQKLINSIHKDGCVFLSSTIIHGKLWLRCAIVSHRTHLEEVDLALTMIRECLDNILN
jgi:aromatic-L-amino-acid/L-tryptophan decarboxylase